MDDLIANFAAITAADTSIAEQYLRVSDNNLEQAIALFFENGGAPLDSQSAPAPASANNDDDEAAARRFQEEEYGQQEEQVRERIQPVTERLVEPGIETFFQRPLSTTPRGPASVFNQPVPIGDEDDSDDMEDDIVGLRQQRLFGTERPTSHQSRLANLFRPPFDIIRNVDLERGKAESLQKGKWLLVNIQKSSEFSCQRLNRDLWSNEQVKDTVRENFTFVQYTDDSEAGQDYATLYPFTEWPHIAILDPRTGEQLKVWSEVPTADKWIEDAHEFLERYSLDPSHRNPVGKIRRNKANPDHMTEEEQIEMAIRQSVGVRDDDDSDSDMYASAGAGDSDIEVIDAQPSSSSKAGTSAAPSKAEAAGADDELTHEDVFGSILPSSADEPAPDPKTTTRIQFLLGDGSRVIRRFNTSDSVRDVFAFAKGSIPVLSGHYFSLTNERRNLIDIVDSTIADAKLQNSVVLAEILDD